MDFSVVEKIVKNGKSKVFNNWREHAPITEDPLDDRGRLTREIGLTPQGIIYLDRVYDSYYELQNFFIGMG